MITKEGLEEEDEGEETAEESFEIDYAGVPVLDKISTVGNNINVYFLGFVPLGGYSFA